MEKTDVERDVGYTEDDLLEAREAASSMSLEEVTKVMKSVVKVHEHDPNFPHSLLIRIDAFLENSEVLEHPERHSDLVAEMKVEAALILNNSPYASVRSAVDNKDDPSIPCSTIRAWVIGTVFSFIMSAVNQFFSIRQPRVSIPSNVAQLLAYPIGKAWEKTVPTYEISLWGQKINLNPGKFSKKEHMLIAIMASTSMSLPISSLVAWTQILPQQFNQQYARSFGYRICLGISTNFIGYGLAGMTREFLVYPAYCIWPASITTISLNSALHEREGKAVPGPFGRIYHMSRYHFFLLTFGAMFVYFWFPNYFFTTLTYFSWMTWIAPTNKHNSIVNGFKNGLGMFNPWPTFDWNILLYDGLDPLMVPFFVTANRTLGMWLLGFVILAIFYTNTWNTGYFPINTNLVHDHFAKPYNVSRVVDDQGMFDLQRYVGYSGAYLSAALAVVYGCYYAIYTSAIVYVVLFHCNEFVNNLRPLWLKIRRKKGNKEETGHGYQDIHNRLMSAYKEVPGWWYLVTLLISAGFGWAGIAGWPTHTTLWVVPFGVLLAIIFMIPIGIINAMTGVHVTLNVLAEFIGGMWVEGNALAMNFFKLYGFITCAHAITFANDLKLAHYLKIPPRATFWAQMVATLISTFICNLVMEVQMDIKNVCTPKAPMRFYCPNINGFFSASVLWGTIGPAKMFSHTGQYALLLLGFPLGALSTVLYYFLVRKFRRSKWLRALHPVALWYGGLGWSPYSFSYAWPSIPVAWLSYLYVKKHFPQFWAKYNFVLSASLAAAIPVASIIMVFSVQWAEIELKWWGNTQPSIGCEGTPCTLKALGKGERFYPWWDPAVHPAP
ncbi:unnamed protein product [Clonostachys rhizophaga]|uniref:Sexual differentiation process protein isp4 n=1 Tax=Clonostachys rhizophaga TaxID=160324 RepID=A0A9N9VH07_9HYPO|nr:unnamed protein product [Clonostachys rhizophaga]